MTLSRFGGLARGLHERLHGIAALFGVGLMAMGLTAGTAEASGSARRHHATAAAQTREAPPPAQATPISVAPPWAATPNLPALADEDDGAPPGSPRAACLEALRAAEARHGLPPGLLVAIGLNESGLHANALNIGGRAIYPETRAEAERLLRQARSSYVMAGCLQVNARVHARGGQVWPLDPSAAAEWAARFLQTHYARSGDWAEVLRRWHGASRSNARIYVCRVRGKIEAVEPNSPIFADRSCGATQLARMRRNAAAHLELAEAP